MVDRREHKRASSSEAERRAEHRRALVEAVSAGDEAAGRALVQHATAAIRNLLSDVDAADSVALNWLADGLQRFLEGKDLDQSLGVRHKHRPRTPSMARFVFEDLPIAQAVNDLAAKLKQEGSSTPIAIAVTRVARSRSISESKVRQALTEYRRVVESTEEQAKGGFLTSAERGPAEDRSAK